MRKGKSGSLGLIGNQRDVARRLALAALAFAASRLGRARATPRGGASGRACLPLAPTPCSDPVDLGGKRP